MKFPIAAAAALSLLAGASAQVRVTRKIGFKKSEAPKKPEATDVDFMPMPPPIECDDVYDDNGIACIYIVNNATTLVTDLSVGNITMPDNNPDFVVSPPATIGAGGGWFSFHTLYSETTNTFETWSGEVQYTAKDSEGDTYFFTASFTFTEGGIDMGFNFPQRHGIDVMPEASYSPSFAVGFQILDK